MPLTIERGVCLQNEIQMTSFYKIPLLESI